MAWITCATCGKAEAHVQCHACREKKRMATEGGAEGMSKFDGFDSIDAFCADSCGNLEGDERNRCIRGCRLVEGEHWNAEHPAMATEGGADLRDALVIDLGETARTREWFPPDVDFMPDEIADAILGAIAEAGMVIVDRRYITIHTCPIDDHQWQCVKPDGWITGDLDGPGGGEG